MFIITCIGLTLPNIRVFAAQEVTPANPLLWNTFIGGTLDDFNYGTNVAVDNSGNSYVCGISRASWGNPLSPFSGTGDNVVVKLDKNGNLVWNTFFGSTTVDECIDIDIGADGYIYIVGRTTLNWGTPVRPYGGTTDAFVAKLDTSGTMIWNSFLGGASFDSPNAFSFTNEGNIIVIGSSNGSWGNPLHPKSSLTDIFVAEVDSNGNLVWNTFWGGSGSDAPVSVITDSFNSIYLAGASNATWGTPLRSYSSGYDGTILKLSSSGSLLWNTFLGGSGADYIYSIRLNSQGKLLFAGRSNATWGSPTHSYNGGYDIFVGNLNENYNLESQDFLGGNGDDMSNDMIVDETGNIYICGSSSVAWGTPIYQYGGARDGLIIKLSADRQYLWHTFIGGVGDDSCYSMTFSDNKSNLLVGGYGNATWRSPIQSYNQLVDGFVLKLDLSAPSTTDTTDNLLHANTVTVNFTCADNIEGSGCNKTYYTIDGSIPTLQSPSASSVTLGDTGEYVIKYFSTDNAGNTESVKTASHIVKIDKNPPTEPIISTIGKITNIPNKSSLLYYFTAQKFHIIGTSEPGSRVIFKLGDIEFSALTSSNGIYDVYIDPKINRGVNDFLYYSQDAANNVSSNRKLTLIVGEEYFPWNKEGEMQSLIVQSPSITPLVSGQVPHIPIPTTEEVTTTIIILKPDGTPLRNHSVMIDSNEYTTDDEGVVRLENIIAGTHTVKAMIENKSFEEVFAVTDTRNSKVFTIKLAVKNSKVALLFCFSLFIIMGFFLMIMFYKRKRDNEKYS